MLETFEIKTGKECRKHQFFSQKRVQTEIRKKILKLSRKQIKNENKIKRRDV